MTVDAFVLLSYMAVTVLVLFTDPWHKIESVNMLMKSLAWIFAPFTIMIGTAVFMIGLMIDFIRVVKSPL